MPLRNCGGKTMADTAAQSISANEVQPIAALWRRFVAYMVDIIILALPTLVGGLLFFDAASSLGEWGRLVAVALIVAYFAYFDSRLGGGQSIGKRLLHIKVTHRNGSFLSPLAAGFRALILAIPLELNGFSLPLGASPLMYFLVSFLLFGLLFSISYLFVFNRSRRSLHDLFTGAVVVDTRAVRAPVLSPLWHGHLVAVILLTAATVAFSLPQPQHDTQFMELEEIRASVQAMPEVRGVGGFRGTMTHWSSNQGSEKFKLLRLDVTLRHKPETSDYGAHNIEDVIFTKYAQTIGDARVALVLRHGFEFGNISSYYKRFVKNTSVAEWKNKKPQ